MSPKIMSPKTLIIAAAALAASAAATLPALAAQPGQQGQTEQARPAPLRADIMFNLVDRNSDGSLDQEEIAALQKAIFSAVDKDGDGKLSKDEFSTLADRGPGRAGRGMDGREMRGPGMRGPGGMGGPGFFHRGMDGRQGQMQNGQGAGPQGPMMQQGNNQDGQLPPDGAQPQNFASLDTNGDGVISTDEFAAAAPGFPGLNVTR